MMLVPSSISAQRGQLMVMAMFGMIPLVLLMAFVFNSGELVGRKMELQNAADAAAMTQATWTARTLNVMAMNNVAMSQTYSIVVVGLSAHGLWVEAGTLMVKEQKEIIDGFQFCASLPPIANGICAAYWAAREGHLLFNITPQWIRIAEDLGGGNFFEGTLAKKIYEFSDITQALSAMNESLVEEFPEFVRSVNQEVGEINGLNEPVKLYSGFVGGEADHNSDYETTGLPVRKVELINGIGQSLLGIAPLKSTADKGTHRPPTSLSTHFHDFEVHGYPRGKGPHPLARDRTKEEVDQLTDDLARPPWPGGGIDFEDEPDLGDFLPGPGKKVKREFSEVERDCWELLASAQLLPFLCYPAPIPRFPRLVVYELEADLLTQFVDANLFADPDDLSIAAFVRSQKEAGRVAGARLKHPSKAVFAYAQAEVYNEKYPDLHTQYWKARLRPATLLHSDQRDEVLAAVESFHVLHDYLTQFDAAEYERINLH